ncbi:threonine synthase [Peptoniphilus harei]|uniref:Threonine synthase n=1 Tax=Peptoniphilus harei TaxID=54005 RepID=A0A2X1WUE8_9FIRM|nr:hypothetical protein [Peptoniphilus harei]SPY32193.1 threonine synthase [Peptoniphilus harei]
MPTGPCKDNFSFHGHLGSSNLERLIFHKSSDEVVKEKMADLKDKGLFEFKSDFHEFLCGFAKEDETRETIKKVFEEENYLMDPHTGVAKNICRQAWTS